MVRSLFVLHFRAGKVRSSTLSYTHTFGLGGSCLVLLGLIFFSGILLMLAYQATPERAYDSVAGIDRRFLFGGFVRNIHYWSSNLLVVVVLLHMLRVLLTGAYHGPRRLNWVIGLGLLFGVLAANFTGYLLPWNQLAYWAVTISTGMLGYFPGIGAWLETVVRGGTEIGSATLVVFYAFHTTWIPVGLIALLGFHFWRVRKAGGVVSPLPADGDSAAGSAQASDGYRPALPDLLMRELAVGLAVIAFVLWLSVFGDAPLGDAANPGMSPNPAKAPWYFAGFQELQLHFHPLFAVGTVPLLVLVGLVTIPYLSYESRLSGPWFLSSVGRRSAAIAAGAALLLTPVLIVLDDFWLLPDTGVPSVVGRAVYPLAMLVGAVLGFAALLRRALGANRAERVQALFVLFLVMWTVLTATGVWFRGPGMALIWPVSYG